MEVKLKSFSLFISTKQQTINQDLVKVRFCLYKAQQPKQSQRAADVK